MGFFYFLNFYRRVRRRWRGAILDKCSRISHWGDVEGVDNKEKMFVLSFLAGKVKYSYEMFRKMNLLP
jgi:hypothetical protein